MTNYAPYPDQKLSQLVAAGDEQAFAALVDRHWRNIYLHTLTYTRHPETAEEITQDIFINLWNKRDKLHEVEQFSAWFTVVVRNRILSSLRKKLQVLAGQQELEDMPEDLVMETLLVPDRQAELKESYQLLLKGIELLPEKRRAVFKMSRLEGLSNLEIAEKLSMHPVTVAQYMAKALVFLRSYMHSHSGDAILIIVLVARLTIK